MKTLINSVKDEIKDENEDYEDVIEVIEEVKKQERFEKSCETEWQKFCDFFEKSENFTENDLKDYFSDCFQRLTNIDVILTKLAHIYSKKYNIDFFENFPNIRNFVLKRKKVAQSQQENVWEKLCEFTNKTENFTKEEMMEFFEILFQRHIPSRLWQRSNTNLVNSLRFRIAKIYYENTSRDFSNDFAEVDNFVTNKVKTEADDKKERIEFMPNFQIYFYFIKINKFGLSEKFIH